MKQSLPFLFFALLINTAYSQQLTPVMLPGYEFANIDAQAVDSVNGKLYVATYLYKKGEMSGRWKNVKIGVLQYDGKTWKEVGRFNNARILGMCVHKGDLYVSGAFDELGDGTPTKNHCAVYHGGVWKSVEGIEAFDPYSNGYIIPVCGVKDDLYCIFDAVSSDRVNNVLKWDGSKWSKFPLRDKTEKNKDNIKVIDMVNYNGELYTLNEYYIDGKDPATGYGVETMDSLVLKKWDNGSNSKRILSDVANLRILDLDHHVFLISSSAVYELTGNGVTEIGKITVDKKETLYVAGNVIVVFNKAKKKSEPVGYKIVNKSGKYTVTECIDPVVKQLTEVQCRRMNPGVVFNNTAYVGYYYKDVPDGQLYFSFSLH
jgi:hypothetical protein